MVDYALINQRLFERDGAVKRLGEAIARPCLAAVDR